jgi:Tol biopolymer transport system component
MKREYAGKQTADRTHSTVTTGPITRGRAPVSYHVVAFFVLALAWTPMASTADEWHRLTEGGSESDVYDDYFSVSPDGNWVAYSHDRDVEDAFEVFTVRVDGTTPPVRIGGLLPAGSPPGSIRISPDSSRIVFISPQDTFGVPELYSAPIAGGPTVKLNGPLVAGGSAVFFLINATSDRVIYYADEEGDGVFELFSVAITGGAARKLNAQLPPGGDVVSYKLNPAGDHVIYTADQEVDNRVELFSVPILGGLPIKLNGTLVPDGDVTDLQFCGSTDRVLYRADQQSGDVFELYSVSMTGGGPVKLSGTMTPGGDVFGSDIQCSPAGDRVTYLADQDTDGVRELYGVAGTGGAVVKLNGPLVAGGTVVSSAIASTGDRVVYFADQEIDQRYEVYSVPIAGGVPIKLNGDLINPGTVSNFQISPDGSWVVYRATQNFTFLPQLFRAPIDGPAGQDEQLSVLRVDENGAWQIDPRGDRVIAVSSSSQGVQRPWRIRLLDPLSLTPEEMVDDLDFAPGGNVSTFSSGLKIATEGSIVYRADQSVDEQFELYSIPSPLFVDGFETGDTSAW